MGMADMGARNAWVARVLGVKVSSPADAAAAAAGRPDGGSEALNEALAHWGKSRAAVIDTLRRYEAGIRALKHPLSDPAIILVKAIAANLTAEPKTKNSVAELRRYLETDAIIDDAETPNGFGITVRIRQPLIAALDVLEPTLAA